MKNIRYISLFILIFFVRAVNGGGLEHIDLQKSVAEKQDQVSEQKPELPCSKIKFTAESFKLSSLRAFRAILDSYGFYYALEITRYWLGKELSHEESWREWQMCLVAAVVLHPFRYNQES